MTQVEAVQETVARLGKGIAELKQNRDSSTQEETFETADAEVRVNADALARGVEVYLTLFEVGLASPAADTAEQTLAKVTVLEQCLEESPLDFKKGGRRSPYIGVIQGLNQAIGELDRRNAIAWAEVVRSQPNPEESWLESMRILPGCSSVVGKLIEDLETMRAGIAPPNNSEELEEYNQVLARVRVGIAELERKEFPQEVKTFFSAVRTGGARLEHFTQEVQAWLKREDLDGHVRIILKGTP